MPHMKMDHEIDPKQKLIEELGDISSIELLNNQVLLALYIRPQKTKAGLFLTDQHTSEDRYQSKVGLLVKRGPEAFVDDGNWFKGIEFKEHDWLVFRPSDGWPLTVNGVLCRVFDDISIKARVQNCDDVW